MSSSAFLKGRVALVTGSTSGIGLGIARALAGQGADIMLNGFGEPHAIAALVREIADQHGVRVLYHPADMSKATDIEDMIRDTEARLGRIDVLVNNAGIQHVAPVESFPVDRWDAIIAINLSSAFHTIRCTLPGMKKRGFGRIINIASVHGLVASAYKTAYVAAKHGVVGLTKSVALETAQTPVTCNAICPGWVLTAIVQKQVDARAQSSQLSQEEAKRGLLIEKQPSGEFVTPEQLGELALFLCSDAASQVRGAAWNMDGGWMAQ
jgi:3-hydroxybutyrate dehydrogenase